MRSIAAALLACAFLLPEAAWSQDKPSNHFITVRTLGDQDYANGSFPNSVEFRGRQSGEPFPFGVFLGSDGGSTSFSASWSFTYGAAPVTGATLTFGIYDHDSAASGDQVASFWLDGMNLTSFISPLFNAPGVGFNTEYNVISLTLPDFTLGALSDGIASFALALKGPNCGISSDGSCPGGGSFNGAALDFASLSLGQMIVREIPAIPEPETYVLMLAGLALLGFAARRRKAVSPK